MNGLQIVQSEWRPSTFDYLLTLEDGTFALLTEEEYEKAARHL